MNADVAMYARTVETVLPSSGGMTRDFRSATLRWVLGQLK